MTCPASTVINAVTFASYGTPTGSCGSFVTSSCNAATSGTVVSGQCMVGQQSCSVSATNANFGDPCSNSVKRLYIQVGCTQSKSIISFFYTGSVQYLTVPDNIYSIHVNLTGAAGGSDFYSSTSNPGGLGGVVSADLSVTPGTTLCIIVGMSSLCSSCLYFKLLFIISYVFSR